MRWATFEVLAVVFLAAVACSGCPPTPPPVVPVPVHAFDLSSPLEFGACDLTVDMGAPKPCETLFVRKGLPHQYQPCALCPVPSSCWWPPAAVRCVPECVPDGVCVNQ